MKPGRGTRFPLANGDVHRPIIDEINDGIFGRIGCMYLHFFRQKTVESGSGVEKIISPAYH